MRQSRKTTTHMDNLVKVLWLAASVLLCSSSVGSALPATSQYAEGLPANFSHPFAHFGMASKKRTDKNIELRILPLGASIMSGTGSSTGNG